MRRKAEAAVAAAAAEVAMAESSLTHPIRRTSPRLITTIDGSSKSKNQVEATPISKSSSSNKKRPSNDDSNTNTEPVVSKPKKKKRRYRGLCSTEGCPNKAIVRGVCVRHDVAKKVKLCNSQGCTSVARTTGGFCKRHGTSKLCSYQGGCTNIAQCAGGLCRRHGTTASVKLCASPGCTNRGHQAGGFCRKHAVSNFAVHQDVPTLLGGGECVEGMEKCTHSAVLRDAPRKLNEEESVGDMGVIGGNFAALKGVQVKHEGVAECV
eukprot:CAMPEP_0201723888 /NCGR_PEP_ID=MMETSP0593-20130828/7775_1 /ASSEMBLY_ACC=CAM_ASM_000672 /TAXON_ID=267983 /ORGANISM="Skeletonema japonicum, Strain CCMP2506" /LENGTH=264 /DNA_ID=CAMNT_0048215043 /DNA_START=169 /DNA_END=964 /DNA_ORIENTATION=+